MTVIHARDYTKTMPSVTAGRRAWSPRRYTRGVLDYANNIWGIVAAAGVGRRMGGDRPKQYLPLHGARVIDHALSALCAHANVRGVVVGVRDGDEYWRARPFAHAKLLATITGGESRARTVLNALQHLLGKVATADDWALVHDAARPCIDANDLDALLTAAREHGDGAALALPVSDALKRVDDGVIESSLSTDAGKTIWRAVTPQMFRCGALADALQHCIDDGVMPADECQAMQRAGVHAAAVAGHPANIKITVAADLELAAAYLAGRAQLTCARELKREGNAA